LIREAGNGGGSFTGLTVRTNDLLADAPPESVDREVIVAVPDWLAAAPNGERAIRSAAAKGDIGIRHQALMDERR